jgi:hypothetical protein
MFRSGIYNQETGRASVVELVPYSDEISRVIAQDLRGDMFVAFPDKFEGLAS